MNTLEQATLKIVILAENRLAVLSDAAIMELYRKWCDVEYGSVWLVPEQPVVNKFVAWAVRR